MGPKPLLDRLSDACDVRGDDSLIARVTGALFVVGAAMVALSLVMSHASSAQDGPMLAVACGALLSGALLIASSRHVTTSQIHLAIALGSALICATVYLSGVAAGVYSTMFVWVVILSAYFFPGRPAAAHLAWLLIAYGATLLMLDDAAGFSSWTRWIFTSLALIVAAAMTSWLVAGRERSESALRREVAARSRLERELRHLAEHDALTGMPNRRFFEEELNREVERANQDGTALSVAAIDLDRFKDFNDSYGHPAGDELLRAATAAWRAALRGSDMIARYGGDEFMVLLPECERDEAERVLERVRAVTPIHQTCSIGIASPELGEPATAETLLNEADAALYRDKARRDPTRMQSAMGQPLPRP
jgi:diguanylate cyclase (GGDEF)-like protein